MPRGLPVDEVVRGLEGDLEEGVRAALLPLDESLAEGPEVQRVHVEVGGEVVEVVVGQGQMPLDHLRVLESDLGGELHSLGWVQIRGRELRAAVPETIFMRIVVVWCTLINFVQLRLHKLKYYISF